MGTLETYERIARVYDLLDLPFEYGRYRRIRPLLFAGLSGRVLDAGVGTGRNMPFYPRGAEMVGIDLSPAMLARAERRETLLAAWFPEVYLVDAGLRGQKPVPVIVGNTDERIHSLNH